MLAALGEEDEEEYEEGEEYEEEGGKDSGTVLEVESVAAAAVNGGAGLVSVQALRLGCGALYLEASVPPPQHPSTQRRHQRNRGTRQVRR